MEKYKLVFAGTPDFARDALEALVSSNHDVVAVYTQPDRPAGRGQKLIASPVKQLAQENQIPVEQPFDFKTPEAINTLKSYDADIMVVAAYGIILPQAVLDAPKLACLNIHASLLPRWRGAAPIQHAILAGDAITGISIMAMDAGLDTGDVLLEKEVPIEPSDTGSSLHDKLASTGAVAILESLEHFKTLFSQRRPQENAKACYATKIQKGDALINWSNTYEQLHRHIRAYNGWPVSFSNLRGKTIRIWEAYAEASEHSAQNAGEIISLEDNKIKVACKDGFINITKLQLPGKKPLESKEVLNAHKDLFAPGNCFE